MQVNYKEILKEYFGFENFRGIQEEIINSIGSGHDTLGLMPTGGGKSMTFQVPALAQEGVCLVITPLIALMKDQVAKLRKLGIKAVAIYGGLTREEILVALENCIFGGMKFLYISPERLSSELFQTKLVHMHVSFITVDESHCISQWGYDFRPSYLTIANVRKLLPDVPILALTATATPEVVKDIQQQLLFKKENVFRMSFERKNLVYVVRQTENKENEMLHILRSVAGTAIIYVRSRERTREIATLLNRQEVSATFYHAGLDTYDKDQRQRAWTNGSVRVMVATNAFGMGIDKPDVRLVIHYEMPDSPEAYFQEAGRAGRDGQTAYAVLLYCPDDKRRLNHRVSDSYPSTDFIREVYDQLNYFYQMALGDGQGCCYDFSLTDFCKAYHLPIIQTESALHLLSRMGYIDYEEEAEYASRLMFTTKRDELYRHRESDPDTDSLLRTLLRLYSGLFSSYVYIDEKYIASQSGLAPETIYQRLIGLSRMKILHYIPARKTPTITYLCNRVEGARLRFEPEVYEERKQNYAQRIKAMNNYVLTQNECRSRVLLRYFGESGAVPCMQCDCCRGSRSEGLTNGMFEAISLQLKQLLNDGKFHSPEEIYQLSVPREPLEKVLRLLAQEEVLQLHNGQLTLTQTKEKTDDTD